MTVQRARTRDIDIGSHWDELGQIAGGLPRKEKSAHLQVALNVGRISTMKLLLLFVALIAFTTSANAWDGVNTETGDEVVIEKGNLVRTGRDIEVYDSNSGEYIDMSVESMTRSGNSVEIELYNSETGETQTYEFDDN
jgi:hypothetical protein